MNSEISWRFRTKIKKFWKLDWIKISKIFVWKELYHYIRESCNWVTTAEQTWSPNVIISPLWEIRKVRGWNSLKPSAVQCDLFFSLKLFPLLLPYLVLYIDVFYMSRMACDLYWVHISEHFLYDTEDWLMWYFIYQCSGLTPGPSHT